MSSTLSSLSESFNTLSSVFEEVRSTSDSEGTEALELKERLSKLWTQCLTGFSAQAKELTSTPLTDRAKKLSIDKLKDLLTKATAWGTDLSTREERFHELIDSSALSSIEASLNKYLEENHSLLQRVKRTDELSFDSTAVIEALPFQASLLSSDGSLQELPRGVGDALLAHAHIGHYCGEEYLWAASPVVVELPHELIHEKLPEGLQKILSAEDMAGKSISSFLQVHTALPKDARSQLKRLNVVLHAWAYPGVKAGGTVKGPLSAGIFPSKGRFISTGSGSVKQDALSRQEVHVHPGAGGLMCCSPNNVHFSIDSKEKVAAFWLYAEHGDKVLISHHAFVVGERESKEFLEKLTLHNNLKDLKASVSFGESLFPLD